MIAPKRVGRFLETDAFGNLVPDVSDEKIGDQWRPIVEPACIRGSVPRGLAIEGISDVNFLNVSPTDLNELEETLAQDIGRQFPLARELEFSRIDHESLLRAHPHQTLNSRTRCGMYSRTL
jgi:hypothetical protein